MSSGHTNHEKHGYEKRDINLNRTIGVGLGSLIFIVIMIIILHEYFVAVREELVFELELAPESQMLNELRAAEDSILNTYGYADTTKSTYRIPIDSAMKMVVEQNSGK